MLFFPSFLNFQLFKCVNFFHFNFIFNPKLLFSKKLNLKKNHKKEPIFIFNLIKKKRSLNFHIIPPQNWIDICEFCFFYHQIFDVILWLFFPFFSKFLLSHRHLRIHLQYTSKYYLTLHKWWLKMVNYSLINPQS